MKLQESNGLLAQEKLRLKKENNLQRDLKNVYKEKLIELQRQVDYKKDWLDLYNTKISIHRMQTERNQRNQ